MNTTRLHEHTIYMSEGDRFVCAHARCCGVTARCSGHGLDGQPLIAITAADTKEWATYGMGPLTCECGRLTATQVDGPHGALTTEKTTRKVIA